MGYVVHFKKKRTERKCQAREFLQILHVENPRGGRFCPGATISGLHVTCLWTCSHYMQSWSPTVQSNHVFWRQWTSSYPSYIDVRGPKLGNPKILWLIIICPMKVWMYTMINPCITHFVGNPHVNHSRSTGRRPWRWPLCRNLWKARRKEMEHGA